MPSTCDLLSIWYYLVMITCLVWAYAAREIKKWQQDLFSSKIRREHHHTKDWFSLVTLLSFSTLHSTEAMTSLFHNCCDFPFRQLMHLERASRCAGTRARLHCDKQQCRIALRKGNLQESHPIKCCTRVSRTSVPPCPSVLRTSAIHIFECSQSPRFGTQRRV